MWTYRYLREYVPDDELMERCNALGEDGWSLLGPPIWVKGEEELEVGGVWRCFFRRVVTSREQLREVFRLPPQEATP